MSYTVLIVEDEADLAEAMAYQLRQHGYAVVVAPDGQTALEAAQRLPRPDVVLLDLMLPDLRGTDVARRIKADRRTTDIPIIMVTARGEEIDRVVGFELGADDYVVKPFSMRELLLRVRNVVRPRADVAADDRTTSVGVLKLDLDAHRVWVEGDEVLLTALDFNLLATLLSRRGRVQSRELLLEEVWGADAGVGARTVDSQVKRLRKKLGPAGDYIETVRGVGYRLGDTGGSGL